MKTPFHLIILKAFHAQRNQVRPYMAELGLSPGQPKILGLLTLRDRCMQKELAAACEIEPATISRLLSTMESAGLIQREPAPGDRRAECISITSAGKQAQKKMQYHFDQVENISLSGFTETEKKQFVEYLCRMYHNLTGRNID